MRKITLGVLTYFTIARSKKEMMFLSFHVNNQKKETFLKNYSSGMKKVGLEIRNMVFQLLLNLNFPGYLKFVDIA
jgi:hypothetical protein